IEQESQINAVVVIVAQVEASLVATDRFVEIFPALLLILRFLPEAFVNSSPQAECLGIIRRGRFECQKQFSRLFERRLHRRVLALVSDQREALDNVRILLRCVSLWPHHVTHGCEEGFCRRKVTSLLRRVHLLHQYTERFRTGPRLPRGAGDLFGCGGGFYDLFEARRPESLEEGVDWAVVGWIVADFLDGFLEHGSESHHL